MLLPFPNLDDRRWADLVEEGRSLIPLYAPEWTDHNISNPGITLMELFAWIAEMDVYQVNRIPEQHRLKFLALIGIRPEPPRPAQTVLCFHLPAEKQPIQLPATVEFEGNDPFGQPTRFRILHGVTVVPAQLAAIQVKDQKGLHDLTSRWQWGKPISLFGDDPQPGTELYLGFRQALPLNVPTSLFFTFFDLTTDEEERARLIQEASAMQERCHAPLSLVTCEEERHASRKDEAPVPPHHSVHTVWEFLVGPDRWQPLQPTVGQVKDDTRAFTLNGQVVVSVPAPMTKARLGHVADELAYLRCRFLAGTYDAAPELINLAVNGMLAEQAVPAGVLNWTIAKDATVEGTASRGNVVGVSLAFDARGAISHLKFGDEGSPTFWILDYQPPSGAAPGNLSIEAEGLGRGTSAPDQRVPLAQQPVQESSFHLYTLEDGHWRSWTLRPDLDASGRSDAHVLLDATQGIVSFGDGNKGRVVPPAARIIARYHATRAEAGNLATATITKLADSPHNRAVLSRTDPATGQPEFETIKQQLAEITNPMRATGGSAAETVDYAEGRAVELVEKVSRAITLADYEVLAMQTPGVRLARVSAWANLHPGFTCLQAPGVITVIVLPYLPLGRPIPSPGLQHAIAVYLSRRRIIGTRVEVVGPTYLEISVQAKVQANRGVSKADLQQRVIQTLNDFLDPLHGGPNRTGWPFGRDVYRSEVLQALDETVGVDHVLSLELIAGGGNPQCGNICLGPTGLVAASEHHIEVV